MPQAATNASPLPTESQEQTCLFRWSQMQQGCWPELRLLYHIPNGGSRHRLEAAHLKQQGVRAGVPDICLPVARGGNHGLYIELKRRKNSRVTPDQMKWISDLLAQGYAAAVCRGCDEAISLITDYLTGR